MSHDPGVFDRDFDNPYQAPKAGAAPVGSTHLSSSGYTGYAGFWVRLVALIVDNIILGVGGFIVMMFCGMLLMLVGGPESDNPAVIAVVLLMYVLLAAANFGYFAFMESSASQATLGKMLMGLKVTDVYGRRLTFWHALGRTLAKILSYLILYIGFLIAAFDGRKQGLHDKIASTLVMKTR